MGKPSADNIKVETPTLVLTTPTDGVILEESMAAERVLTMAKLEADIRKAQREAEDATERAKALMATLHIYYPDSQLLRESREEIVSERDRFASLNIGEACERILRDARNEWQSLTDLDGEIERRGKQCSKGSIEIMLKEEPEKFEIKKEGRRNLYRLRNYDVNTRTAR